MQNLNKPATYCKRCDGLLNAIGSIGAKDSGNGICQSCVTILAKEQAEADRVKAQEQKPD